MNVLVVYLQNYFPKGVIDSNYCNKVDIYSIEQSDLIEKIYKNLLQKLDMFDQYVCLIDNKKVIVNKDINLPIINQQGSANGAYHLFIYHSNVN